MFPCDQVIGLRLLIVEDTGRGNTTYLRARGDCERLGPMLPDPARRVGRLGGNRPADVAGGRIFYSSRGLHGETYEPMTESRVPRWWDCWVRRHNGTSQFTRTCSGTRGSRRC